MWFNSNFVHLLQPNLPNGTESSNSSFQDKTVIKNGKHLNILSVL